MAPLKIHKPVPVNPALDRASDDVSDGTLSIKRAVAFSDLSKSSIYKAIAEGKIEAFKVEGKRLICKKSLIKFLARHKLATQEPK